MTLSREGPTVGAVADAEIPESVPGSGLELALLEKRAKRRRLLIAVGGLVLLGGVIAGGLTYHAKEQRKQVDVAFGELSKCLLGPPLDGEPASLRFRRVQLSAVAVPPGERGKPGEPVWPATCATYSHKLAERADAAGLGKKGEAGIGKVAEALAARLKEDGSLTANLGEPIDHLWNEAASAKLSDLAAPDVKSPADPAESLDADALKAAPGLSPKSFALDALQTSPYPTGTLRFLIDDKDMPKGPALCRLAGTVADGPNETPKVQCKTLGALAKASPGLRLWGTSEADVDPWIFAGDRGAGGIFKPDGTSPAAVMTYGAHLREDGALDYLFWDDEESKVRRGRIGGGEVDELIFSTDDVGNPYYSVGVLWGHIVSKGWSKSGNLALFARPIDGDEKDTVLVGELAEPGRVHGSDDFPHVSGCRTSDAIIARVRGSSGDQLAFLSGSKWQAPLFASGLGAAMVCRGNEVVLTRLAPGHVGSRFVPILHQNRCSAAACKEAEVSMTEITAGVEELYPQGAKHIQAVDVGGKVLVVWNPGEPYGLRMKIDSIDNLGKAPMRVLFDDLRQEQTVRSPSSLFGFSLLSRGDVGVIVLSTVAGVHLLQVDPEGKLTPVAVEWADG